MKVTMANRIRRQLRSFIFSTGWEKIEIYGAVTKITWAAYLLAPGRAFRAIQGYGGITDERVLGIILLVIGILHLLSVVKEKKLPRQIMTFIGFSFWIWTSIIVFQQAGLNAILIFFTNLSIFMFLNFLRLAVPEGTRVDDIGPPDGLEERRKNV